MRWQMNDDEDQMLDDALFRLAVGATVEEIGKDADGKAKVFKRKLPPNLDAIKYLKEHKKKSGSVRYTPKLIRRDDDSQS